MGRKSSYTKKLGAEICQRIAEGETLRSICKDDGMPQVSTVIGWALSQDKRYKAFSEQYKRAREIQLEVHEDEITDIADDGSNDWMIRKRRDGTEEEVFNNEHFQRSRLRVEVRERLIQRIRGGAAGAGKGSKGGDPNTDRPQTVNLIFDQKPTEPKQ